MGEIIEEEKKESRAGREKVGERSSRELLAWLE